MALLNAGMNRVVNRLSYGDPKIEFIPRLSNADIDLYADLAAENQSLLSVKGKKSWLRLKVLPDAP
jgi:hypothetical protein